MNKILGKVPSRERWDINAFRLARRKQYDAEIASPSASPWPGVEMQVLPIPEDDEVICDTCSAEILGPTVLMVSFGNRAVCDTCAKLYEREPVTWRELKPDGSLGRYL